MLPSDRPPPILSQGCWDFRAQWSLSGDGPPAGPLKVPWPWSDR